MNSRTRSSTSHSLTSTTLKPASETPAQHVRFAVREGATSESGTSSKRARLTKCGRWGNALVMTPATATVTTQESKKWNLLSMEKGITSELDLKGGNMIQKRRNLLEETHCVGGSRNTAECVSRLHAVKAFGSREDQQARCWRVLAAQCRSRSFSKWVNTERWRLKPCTITRNLFCGVTL